MWELQKTMQKHFRSRTENRLCRGFDGQRSDMAGAEENTRIVLLGKTGSGKSSLANTMFGEKDTFTSGSSAKSVTNQCQSETRTIKGRNIQLIDTPGFFDTDLKSDELRPAILRCIVESAPGPHAFLLTFPLGRFTSQEEAIVDLTEKEYFGEEALKYTTVVFTHGDQLDEGMKIEEWVNENESLKKLVDKCGGRCCVIDNKYWNNSQDPYRNNQNQIEQLLKTIDQTVRENGEGCYTNELLQTVQKKIEEGKAVIKESSPNISEESANKEAKQSVFNFLKNNLAGVAVGVLVGAFLGGAAGFALVNYYAWTSLAVKCIAVGGGAAVGAAVGAVGGAGVSQYVIKPVANAVKKKSD